MLLRTHNTRFIICIFKALRMSSTISATIPNVEITPKSETESIVIFLFFYIYKIILLFSQKKFQKVIF